MLGLRLVKPGLLPVELVKDFKLLQSRRADVDYGDIDTISQFEAEGAVEMARNVLGCIEQLRKNRLTLTLNSTP